MEAQQKEWEEQQQDQYVEEDQNISYSGSYNSGTQIL